MSKGNKEIEEYIILDAYNKTDLANQVEEHLMMGYHLSGGVGVSDYVDPVDGRDSTLYAQAMVR